MEGKSLAQQLTDPTVISKTHQRILRAARRGHTQRKGTLLYQAESFLSSIAATPGPFSAISVSKAESRG